MSGTSNIKRVGSAHAISKDGDDLWVIEMETRKLGLKFVFT